MVRAQPRTLQARLALALSQLCLGTSAEVLVYQPERSEEEVNLNGGGRVNPAGLAQLFIAAYCLHYMGRDTVRPEVALTIRPEHRRPGTGLLQAFPDGYRLSLSQALELMVGQSDLTATNLLLEHLGGQGKVADWLHLHGMINTGLGYNHQGRYLTEEFYLSDLQAFLVLVERLRLRPRLLALMQRSHCRYGFLRAYGGRRASGLPGKLLVRALQRYHGRAAWPYRLALGYAHRLRGPSGACAKEGLYPSLDGQPGLFHQLAYVGQGWHGHWVAVLLSGPDLRQLRRAQVTLGRLVRDFHRQS